MEIFLESTVRRPGAPEPAPGRSGTSRQGPVEALIDPCDASKLMFAPHAHSLYAHTLAERGGFGLLAIGGLLFSLMSGVAVAIALTLYRRER